MNLEHTYGRRSLDIEEYKPSKSSDHMSGAMISKVVLDGPLKMLMEKIEQFNNDWIRPRYLNNNRSVLSPLEDIGLTNKLNWQRGTVNTIEQLFVDRLLQFNKGGAIGLKFVRRPKSTRRQWMRAQNDLDSIETSLKQIKSVGKNNLTDESERKRMENFLDEALEWFFNNVDSGIEMYKNSENISIHPYFVSLQGIQRSESTSESRMTYNGNRYKIDEPYIEALDMYRNLHKEFIVAVHFHNPTIKYHTNDSEYIGDIDTEPVTVLFRYHLTSLVQRWIDDWYGIWQEYDSSKNSFCKYGPMEDNKPEPYESRKEWLHEMLNRQDHHSNLPLMLGDRSITWLGGDPQQRMYRSELEDPGYSNYDFEEGSYHSMSGFDVSGIYHGHNDGTFFPFINRTSRTGQSGWGVLTQKKFFSKLFKDMFGKEKEGMIREGELKKHFTQNGDRNYDREWQFTHSMPKACCFGNLQNDIYQAGRKGNFTGLGILLTKWMDYYNDRTNPLNSLNNCILTLPPDSEGMGEKRGSTDWAAGQLLLRNGLGQKISRPFGYFDFVEDCRSVNFDLTSIALLKSDDRYYFQHISEYVNKIQAAFRYFRSKKPDHIGSRYRGYGRSRIDSNAPDLDNVVHTGSEGFDEYFIKEVIQETLSFDYQSQKVENWKNTQYQINSDIEEHEDTAMAISEENAYGKMLREAANPESRPILRNYHSAYRYESDYTLSVIDMYKVFTDTYLEIKASKDPQNYHFVTKYEESMSEGEYPLEMFLYDLCARVISQMQREEINEAVHEPEEVHVDTEETVADFLDNIISERVAEDEANSSSFDFTTEEGRAEWSAHIRRRNNR